MKFILFFILLLTLRISAPAYGQLLQPIDEWYGTINADTAHRGITISTGTRALTVGIPPRAVQHSTRVVLRQMAEPSNAPSVLPPVDGMRYTSSLFSYEFVDIFSLGKNLNLALESTPVTHHAGVYLYDLRSSAWFPLATTKIEPHYFRAVTDSVSGYVAVFEYENDHAEFLGLVRNVRAVAAVDSDARTIIAHHSGDLLSIASLTKLMTALVFLDHNPGWDTRVKIEKRDDAPPAKLPLLAGDVLTTRSLFSGMLVGSKNNAAKALQRSTKLSEKEFVRQMNDKAKKLGMANTKFVDVTGLSSQNRSTAQDMTLLLRGALAVSDIRKETSRSSVAITLLNRKKVFRVQSTDDLILAGIPVAGKTGYLPEAGYNFAGMKREGKRELFFVILGASSSRERFTLAKAILSRQWPNGLE